MDKMKLAIMAIALALASAYIGRCSTPEPAPLYRNVIVTKKELVKGKPDTIIRLRDRIIYRVVTPEVIAVAPHVASETVEEFCKASPVAVGTTPADSLSTPPKPVPMLFDAGAFDGRHLKLWEARANGDAAAENFNVHAPLTFAVKDGRALVKGSRTWWVRPLLTHLGAAGLGYLAGRMP